MPRAEVGPLRLFGHRSPRRLTGVATIGHINRPRRFHLGATVHRGGGVSVIGMPRRGGTSIVWGEGLRERLDRCACDCTRVGLGPVTVHFGEDF